MGSHPQTWVYPDECQLCGKQRIQHNNKRYKPYTITTFDAAKAIQNAAQVKNEALFSEIEHLDLITKEFKVHHICYKQFTFCHSSTSDTLVATEAEKTYAKGKFEEVEEYIIDVVMKEKRAASIKTLHEIYGIGIGDTRYRSKLKDRIVDRFGDQICFLTSSRNKPEIIVCAEYFTSDSVHYDSIHTIQHAAKLLQKDIFDKFKETPQPTWPPTATELQSDKFTPPSSLILFMKALLTFSKTSIEKSANISRLAESFAQDIVYGVTRGKVLQVKHFLLALGLHNLSGSRKVIDLVNKFGHCITYNSTCEIETAQAESAQEQSPFSLSYQAIWSIHISGLTISMS